MPVYYIKDRANAHEPEWSSDWQSTHKGDLKGERDRLNAEHSFCSDPLCPVKKRFVIGEMR